MQRLTLTAILTLLRSSAAFAQSPLVLTIDPGPTTAPSNYECTAGHSVLTHLISLQNSLVRYQFRYSGCTDPSHGDLRPSAEGNFGMPEPVPANWYWGGFFRMTINGQEVTKYKLRDMRATESGARGGFQVIWEHPDAEVSMRIILPPASNHVRALLKWQPRPDKALKEVKVNLTCYPSFFTNRRKGERHCMTPRTDAKEPQTLTLEPDKDTFLYYYDTVFDIAKGQGAGPCAAIVAPEALQSGVVRITNYPVVTELTLKPDAKEARFCFYDLKGRTNAEAEKYLRTCGAQDLSDLQKEDFRPLPLQSLKADALTTESNQLLADAAEEGKAYKPQVEKLLGQIASLKAQADAGDWVAEAQLSDTIQSSADLFWKLRAQALLNRMK
ncbi:MAG: hypothetical protein ABFE07_20310 [Armatimonadia bacterium]